MNYEHLTLKNVDSFCRASSNYGCWYDTEHRYRGIADGFLSAYSKDKHSQILGKTDIDLNMKYAKLYEDTNKEVTQLSTPYYGIMPANWPSWGELLAYTVKIPVYDDQNNIAGTTAICYPLNISEAKNLLKNLPEINSLIKDGDSVEITNPSQNADLSVKEQECLYYILTGKTAKEIARYMDISYKTVEFHTSNLKIKFNCQTKPQLIALACSLGYQKHVPQSIIKKLSEIS